MSGIFSDQEIESILKSYTKSLETEAEVILQRNSQEIIGNLVKNEEPLLASDGLPVVDGMELSESEMEKRLRKRTDDALRSVFG